MVLSSTWCFFLLVWLPVCFCLFVFLFVCLFVSGWNSALNFFVSFIHYWYKWYKIKKTKTFSFQKQYNIRKSTLIIWERFFFLLRWSDFFYYHILTVALMDPRSYLASSVYFVKFFKFFLIQKPAYRKWVIFSVKFRTIG